VFLTDKQTKAIQKRINALDPEMVHDLPYLYEVCTITLSEIDADIRKAEMVKWRQTKNLGQGSENVKRVNSTRHISTALTASLVGILSIAPPSTANTQATPNSSVIIVESVARMVVEPPPILWQFSGAYAVSPFAMNFSMRSGSNRRHAAHF